MENSIYEINGYKVMLDSNLAIRYEVETEKPNLSVKRNIPKPDRFSGILTNVIFFFITAKNASIAFVTVSFFNADKGKKNETGNRKPIWFGYSRRFPNDFMFQLTKEEWTVLRLQIETSNDKEIRYLSSFLKHTNCFSANSTLSPRLCG